MSRRDYVKPPRAPRHASTPGAAPRGRAGGTVLRRGNPVTFTWSGVAGATRYLFDFEGGPDPGRLGGNLIVTGTSLPALVPTTVPAGSYRVRVLGLSATGAPVGTFSDPLDLTIQP